MAFNMTEERLPSRRGSGGAGAGGSAGGGGSSPVSYPVVVLLENRSREVGLAVINLAAPAKVQLLQLADNQCFGHTLSYLDLIAPVEIVLCRSRSEGVLYNKVVDAWGAEDALAGSAGHPTALLTIVNRKRVVPRPLGRLLLRPRGCTWRFVHTLTRGVRPWRPSTPSGTLTRRRGLQQLTC